MSPTPGLPLSFSSSDNGGGVNGAPVLLNAPIEAKLSSAQVIDVTSMENEGRVIFGATVKLNGAENKTLTYQIVGEDEADIKVNKISYSSPIGRALIAKQLDDVVSVHTPGGLVEYEIIDVKY